jgi:hypothetical protein
MIVIVSTLGLIIYINFADGTFEGQFRGDNAHLEVRDRDYFFTPGYMFLAMCTGLGLAILLHMLDDLMRRNRLPNIIIMALAGIVVATPVVPLTSNWFILDRSRNWIPRDYAYNILNSCEENAVLFTNGDNDTFPLWFIQAVEGVRTDVRVTNLSLLNTPWHIKQLKNDWDVPITFTDEQIEKLGPYRDRDGKVHRVQDIMVRHIINSTKQRMTSDSTFEFDPPIFFAATVDRSGLEELNPYLKMTGHAFKLVTEAGGDGVDVEKMHDLVFEKFQFRGLNDPTIYLDDNSNKLIMNYITAFMRLSDGLFQQGDTSEVSKMMDFAMETLPYSWRLAYLAGDVYSRLGNAEKVVEAYKMIDENDLKNEFLAPIFVRYLRRVDRPEFAIEIAEKAYEVNPNDANTALGLMQAYYLNGQTEKMQDIYIEFRRRNPNNSEIDRFFQRAPAQSESEDGLIQ